MTHHMHDPGTPRSALLGAAALVALAVLLVGLGRISGVGVTRVAESTPVAVRALRFEDRGDGAVVVYEAPSNRLVDVIAPGTNGFLRGVLRGFARERRRSSADASEPFRLTRWADGRLSLDDPVTGRHVNLEVFGPTNVAVFAQLLYASTAPPTAEPALSTRG